MDDNIPSVVKPPRPDNREGHAMSTIRTRDAVALFAVVALMHSLERGCRQHPGTPGDVAGVRGGGQA